MKIRLLLRMIAALAFVALLAVLLAAVLHRGPFAARSASSTAPLSRRVLYWYDPMHPAYTSSKPGIAPDCGMALVPRYADEATAADRSAVGVSAARQQQIGIQTIVVTRQDVDQLISTTARIIADETRIEHVHVKVPGYVDHVFANYTGQAVRKGDPLFTFYSPELVAAEQEYLIARRGHEQLSHSSIADVARASSSLVDAAREHLRLWDVTDAELHAVETSGQPQHTITVYAPSSGVVSDRKAFPQTAITPDTDLYTLTDIGHVWAMVDISEDVLPQVHMGQPVTLRAPADPTHELHGTISFIEPALDPQTRTARARVALSNPGSRLRLEMFLDAEIHIHHPHQLVVLRDAVLDAGDHQQVYVRTADNRFVPRAVRVSQTIGESTLILDGLQPGEEVVARGNFLLDSESHMQSAAPEVKP